MCLGLSWVVCAFGFGAFCGGFACSSWCDCVLWFLVRLV